MVLSEHGTRADRALRYNRLGEEPGAQLEARSRAAPLPGPLRTRTSAPPPARVGARRDRTGRGGARSGDPPLLPSHSGVDWQSLGPAPTNERVPGAGPGTKGSGYLRVVASAVGSQSGVRTVRVERAPEPAPTAGVRVLRGALHRTIPRGTEWSRSPTRRPGRSRHHRLHSTHGDQKTLKEFGVSGAGKSPVRKGGWLSLPGKRFSFDCLDPVSGRRERGVLAESGPSYTILTHIRTRTHAPH